MEHKIINCSHCGKIISNEIKAYKRPPAKCPECGNYKNFKVGFRYTDSGKVQRYLCRDCGYRFSSIGWGGI